jgi:hypothetical protein
MGNHAAQLLFVDIALEHSSIFKDADSKNLGFTCSACCFLKQIPVDRSSVVEKSTSLIKIPLSGERKRKVV